MYQLHYSLKPAPGAPLTVVLNLYRAAGIRGSEVLLLQRWRALFLSRWSRAVPPEPAPNARAAPCCSSCLVMWCCSSYLLSAIGLLLIISQVRLEIEGGSLGQRGNGVFNSFSGHRLEDNSQAARCP